MIELKHVSKTYETGNRAVRNLTLRIEDGEFVFIVGKSGSGKSTLFKLITRELLPTEGSIEVNEWDLRRMKQREVPRFRRTLGVIFQDFRLLNDRTVFENIAFAQRVIGASTREIRENVPKMLKLTGLSSKYKSLPCQLSGGEQQRVAIARALINHPSVILADEPTGNLDESNTLEIMRLLEAINRMGTTVVVITHSRAVVEAMHKRVIRLERGVIVSDRAQDGTERVEQRAVQRKLQNESIRGNRTGKTGETEYEAQEKTARELAETQLEETELEEAELEDVFAAEESIGITDDAMQKAKTGEIAAEQEELEEAKRDAVSETAALEAEVAAKLRFRAKSHRKNASRGLTRKNQKSAGRRDRRYEA